MGSSMRNQIWLRNRAYRVLRAKRLRERGSSSCAQLAWRTLALSWLKRRMA